jgi:hypothetical protein
MPELHELRITTRFDQWRYPVTHEPTNVWIENNRGLLWTAAWATRNHTMLKYAVWDEHKTVVDGKIDDEIYVKPVWDDRPTIRIEVTITKTKPGSLQNADRQEGIEKRNAMLVNGEDPEVIRPLEVRLPFPHLNRARANRCAGCSPRLLQDPTYWLPRSLHKHHVPSVRLPGGSQHPERDL